VWYVGVADGLRRGAMLIQKAVAVLAGLFAASGGPAGRVPSTPTYVIESPDIVKIDVSGLPGKAQPIRGDRLVRSDGTVSLGTYGSISVSGLTPDEVRAAVLKRLAGQVKRKWAGKLEVRVEVTAFNSKFYSVITDFARAGEQVTRLPLTGNETVRDAITRIGGLAATPGKRLWISRAAPTMGGDLVLQVDWEGITQRGRTETNYQLLPRDRVFVVDHSPPK
jgi:protein involved in polysaccharide export with SLBB domain